MSKSHCAACQQEARANRGVKYRRLSTHTCKPEGTVMLKDDDGNQYNIPKSEEGAFVRLVYKLTQRRHDVNFCEWANELIDKYDQYRIN